MCKDTLFLPVLYVNLWTNQNAAVRSGDVPWAKTNRADWRVHVLEWSLCMYWYGVKASGTLFLFNLCARMPCSLKIFASLPLNGRNTPVRLARKTSKPRRQTPRCGQTSGETAYLKISVWKVFHEPVLLPFVSVALWTFVPVKCSECFDMCKWD